MKGPKLPTMADCLLKLGLFVELVRVYQSAKEQAMPFINVKLIEGVFSEPQKQQIAKSLTDAMVQIEG